MPHRLPTLPPRSLLARPIPKSLQRQESGLVVLNLAILAGIAVVHALFAPAMGSPATQFFVALFLRILILVGELFWLQGERRESQVVVYLLSSITANLLFAFVLARLSGFEDSHYVVLMVIPVLAGAFRLRPAGIAMVLATAAFLTVFQLWLYYRQQGKAGAPSEYFEAASVVLLYALVTLAVGWLAREMRGEQRSLAQSLDALQETRERLVAEEKLAAIGRLASGIAHEIRNPVAMILSSLSMAKKGGGLPRPELEEIVEQEALRLERLTSDFLLYARQKAPETRPTRLAPSLGSLADLCQARLAERGIELVQEAPESLAAEVDPFQLHQALLNLLLNAIDATPRGGTILLAAQPEPPEGVLLSVENSGPAIPPEVERRIFEPFFTTKPAGSGLGLAIARTLVRAHGGELRLARNEKGAVRFALSLPGRCAPPGHDLPPTAEREPVAWRAS